jgi:hypothetical protein
MTQIPRRWPILPGIEIHVSLPRWLLVLITAGAGVLIVLLIAAGLLLNRADSGGGDAAAGIGITGTSMNGANQRFTLDVTLGAASRSFSDNGWTVLLADGSIIPARVVTGPATFEGGTTTHIEIEAGTKPGVAPIAVRFDPDKQLGLSVAVRGVAPR